MKVAINTPNGNIGRALAGRLLDAGAELILLTRSPDKIMEFTDRGAAARVGSLEDAEFVVRAVKGADVLFWLTPPNMAASDFRAYQNKLGDIAVRAAAENRIPRVVNLSSIGAHHVERNRTDRRPSRRGEEVRQERRARDAHPRRIFHGELVHGGADDRVGRRHLHAGPREGAHGGDRDTRYRGGGRRARSDGGWTGRTVIELIGPAEVTFEGMADTLGKALGKKINYVTITLDQMRQAFTGMGVPGNIADLYVEMYAAFDDGKVAPEFPKRAALGSTSLGAFAEQVYRPAFEAMTKAQPRV
jgi:uncharacterized protein YbjT (DUF2867 family)